ncbi:unnamed protein product [Withania somnifera]
MPFIIGNETFEKLGAIGTLSNLLIYLTAVFNLKHIAAATLINGLFVITLTAVFKKLHPPHCDTKDISQCIGQTGGQMAFLLSGFGLLIIGAAGIRPCNLAFGADQFNPNTESGKRGINSSFNWYLCTLTFAQMVSVTLVVYIQSDISWSIGLAIAAIFMLISFVSIKKRKLNLPEEPWKSLFDYTPHKSINSKLPYTHQFGFLDKAATVTPEDQINSDGSAAYPWNLCSVQQVQEAKCVLRVIPIWTAAIVYHTAITQQQQFVLHYFSMLSLTLWIPIYDRIVVPLLRRITAKEGGITILQRMGFGIFLTVLSSLVSAFIEKRRRKLVIRNPALGLHSERGLVSSMSALWLVPQLSLAGLAEAFCAIGQVEFYYKQFPENMRSIAGSFILLGNGCFKLLEQFLDLNSNWLPEDLNKGRLDYFYFLITALGILNVVYFIICSRWYKYKGSVETSSVTLEMERKNVEKHFV